MDTIRAALGKIKQRILYEIQKRNIEREGYFKKRGDMKLAPVFLLGSNRSGTSLISSIMGQHPSLEGIFDKYNEPDRKSYGHLYAYCTSHHVWPFWNPSSNWYAEDEGVLWGHPKNIGKYYRDRPTDDREALFLANLLKSYMKTDKTPFLNSHFNMFKVGLLTKVFPNAKFVLIIRDFQDYIRSCSHKWTKEKIEIEYPKIGLHWLTLNNTCIYDLKKYAPDNFAILEYSSLFQEHEKTNAILNVKFQAIGLDPFDYNLDIVNTGHRHLGDEYITDLQFEEMFGCIDSMLEFEKKLVEGFSQ